MRQQRGESFLSLPPESAVTLLAKRVTASKPGVICESQLQGVDPLPKLPSDEKDTVVTRLGHLERELAKCRSAIRNREMLWNLPPKLPSPTTSWEARGARG